MIRIARRLKSTKLAFNPLKDGDFTEYGVLPFFQAQLNKILLPKSAWHGDLPDYNVQPLEDQRKMLSILGSGHNVILKGDVSGGKSLGLLLYALNLSLSATPGYNMLRTKSKLDSIILVPTPEIVKQYEKNTQQLLKGIPEECCPDLLTKSDPHAEYELTRSPLSIEFLYGGSKSSVYSTGKHGEAQILVTTLEGLEDLRDAKSSEQTSVQTKSNSLESVRFIAVDNIDTFVNTPVINNYKVTFRDTNSSKQRYYNKVERFIQHVQKTSTTVFESRLRKRLYKVERSFSEGKNLKSSVDHTNVVLAYNHLKDKKLDPEESGLIPDLFKRLMREKRALLYKPIQYAFVGLQDPPYKRFIEAKNNIGTSRSEDPRIRLAENSVRLTNEQRKLRETENAIISASSEYKHITKEDGIVGKFFVAVPTSARRSQCELVNLDIVTKAPKLEYEHWNMIEKLKSSVNLKNAEKLFLKSRVLPSPDADIFAETKTIAETIAKNVKSNLPALSYLMVFPNYMNLKILLATFRKRAPKGVSYTHFKDFKGLESELAPINNSKTENHQFILANVLQMLSANLGGIPNIIVIGLDSLLPTFAFPSREKYLRNESKPTNVDDITGLTDPVLDLSHMYLQKLRESRTSEKKTAIFVLNLFNKTKNKNKKKILDNDMQRFSQIILFNKLYSELIHNATDKKSCQLEYKTNEVTI